MKVTTMAHGGKELTGRQMYQVTENHWSDLGRYAAWSFPAFFEFVREIPYSPDDEKFPARVVEVVSRPKYLLDGKTFPRMDCKKKAVLIGSWAKANGFPYRYVAVSHRPTREVHHVMPQIDFGRGWVNADATFPQFEIGQGQPVTFAAELSK